MNGEYLLYLQEIKETEWVIELISEQFDDAMNMMTPNSIIYGGAVRDCLAGKDLLGDLDIAVPASECTTMINKFIKNPKWVNISGRNNDANYKRFSSVPKLFSESPRNPSQVVRTPQIMTFKTLGNKIVQIIILPTGDDPFQTVTTMVKQVDIVCCGVILTNDNKVFEVVPDAYKDCKKHILRLNNVCYVKDIEKFKQRIEKLSERGWINEININKVIRTVNRRRKQNFENKKIIAGISKHTSVNSENYIHNIKKSDFVDSFDKNAIMKPGYILLRAQYTPQEGATGGEIKFGFATGTSTLTHTGYRSIVSSSDIGHIGGLSDTLYALEILAKKYRLDIIAQPIKNCLIITTRDKYISDQVHNRLMGKVKRSDGSIAPLSVGKKSKGVAPPIYTNTTRRSYKSSVPLTYVQLDKQTTDTSGIGGALGNSTPAFKGINKRTLDELHRKKGADENITKYFNYSIKARSEATTTITNRHYRGIAKNEIARIGGIAIILIRLERIAKKHKIDIGVIVEKSIVKIITDDYNISKHVYELLTAGGGVPLRTNTKMSGGTAKWV